MSKEYEILDPDNQDRPIQFYDGVRDTADYVAGALAMAYRGERPAEIEAIMSELEGLITDAEDRRRQWFAQHMNVKVDPARKDG